MPVSTSFFDGVLVNDLLGDSACLMKIPLLEEEEEEEEGGMVGDERRGGNDNLRTDRGQERGVEGEGG
jgi:hypothetical protein